MTPQENKGTFPFRDTKEKSALNSTLPDFLLLITPYLNFLLLITPHLTHFNYLNYCTALEKEGAVAWHQFQQTQGRLFTKRVSLTPSFRSEAPAGDETSPQLPKIQI